MADQVVKIGGGIAVDDLLGSKARVVIPVPNQLGALRIQNPVQAAVASVLQRIAVDCRDLAGRVGGDGLGALLKESVAFRINGRQLYTKFLTKKIIRST